MQLETIDSDQIDANYADGVLTLQIPVAEKAKPRRVPINISNGQTSISTTAQEPATANA